MVLGAPSGWQLYLAVRNQIHAVSLDTGRITTFTFSGDPAARRGVYRAGALRGGLIAANSSQMVASDSSFANPRQ